MANFITYSLLPVLVIAFSMLGFHYLFFRREPYPQRKQMYVIVQYGQMALSIFLGIIVLFLIFKVTLNYDAITRYGHAIQLHHQIKGKFSLDFSIQSLSLFRYFLLGANAEFTFWTGYASIILSLIALGTSVKNLIGKKIDRTDWIVISFFFTFILLNLSGQTSNETGRLWIFLTPLLALFSAGQAVRLFPQPKHGVYFFMFLQLVTTYLIFHFSDFGP